MVVFHSPLEHRASVAIHGSWVRPPAELVLEAGANGGFGNDVHDSCAEFLGWLLAQSPRPGTFSVFSSPGAKWNGSEDERQKWYGRVMGVLVEQKPPAVLVNLDDYTVTQGDQVLWRPPTLRSESPRV